MDGQIIKSRSFQISNSDILKEMWRKSVQYIRYSIDKVDQSIVVKIPDSLEDLTLGKSWMKVTYGKKKIYTRTPTLLSKHVGKEVVVYQDVLSDDQLEIFRIKPINFSVLNRKRRVELLDPYFTKGGSIVIPRMYINKYLNDCISYSRLSFNKMNTHIASEGYILGYFSIKDETGDMIYPLKECSNGIRTRPLNNLCDFIGKYGKNIGRYRYMTTVKEDGFTFGVMVFKEMKDD